MYVLPYGQMSLWGLPKIAPNAYLIINNLILIIEECLVKMYNVKPTVAVASYRIAMVATAAAVAVAFLRPGVAVDLDLLILSSTISAAATPTKTRPQLPCLSACCLRTTKSESCYARRGGVRLQAKDRIGPHNKDILTVLFGSLLGDCHAEHRSKGTRFCFYQESSHDTYLLWLHDYLLKLGYCNNKTPQIQTRLGKGGKVRKVIRFKTWTYANLNWVYDLWYINNKKIVPSTIGEYLTPLGLSVWIMDDGSKVNKGLKLCTNSFTFSDNLLLVKVLYDNFNIKSSVVSAGFENQYNVYIWKESMPLLRDIVLPYVHPSMKYKLSY